MTKSVGAGIDAERASGVSMTRPMHSADSDPSNTDSGIDDLGSYLDSLPDPAIAVGQDGLIVDSNSLFLDLSGYGIDQIRHLSVESIVPGELRGANRTYRSELPSSVRRRRTGSTLDLKLQRKDGSLCPVDISLSMVHFKGKRISIATARDMTERRVALAREISSAADLLSDMGRIVGESRSLEDLYRTVSEMIHKVVPADRVSIVSHSASDSFYEVEFATGTQLSGIAAGDRLAISGTLVGSVIATGEPILGLGEPLDELRSRYPGLSDQLGTRFKTFACVPLKTVDSIVGALFISAHDAHAFSRTDIENVMLIAPQFAGAISVLRQRIAASTARDEALVVSEIARAAGETLDLAKLFDLVRLKITAHIPYDRFTVLHFDAARDVWILGYQYGLNPGKSRIGAALPISERTGIEFRNLEGPRILSTSDVQELEGIEPLWRQASAAGIRSALRLPVRWDGRVITVINLLSKKPDAYDLRHAALGDRIASHIAGPIANAELHAVTASLANEVGLLAEIGRFAGDLRNLDSALDNVFDLSQRLLPASRAAVSIIDSETQRIDTVARIGRRLPKASQIQIDDGVKSVIQDVMKSGEPRVIDNAMIQSACNDSELAKAYRDLGFQSILIVPLIAHGSPIGFITWWSEKDRAFDGNGVRLGERIAAQLAGPIANWDATRKLKSVALERQLIADVGTAFSKYPEFQDAFDASVKLLAEHFPITRAFVSQVNPTAGTATVISLFGLESDDTRVGPNIP